MKSLLLFLMLFGFNSAFCQLQIDDKSKAHVPKTEEEILNFTRTNHINYALIGWYNMEGAEEYNCLLEQYNRWYLAKIISVSNLTIEPIKYRVKQQQLNKAEADSLKLIFDASLAFEFTLENLEKLHTPCQVYVDGRAVSMKVDVADGSTFHLLQIDHQKFKLLYYYAPDFYFDNCYPSMKEFGILKGLINTVTKLNIQTKNLKD